MLTNSDRADRTIKVDAGDHDHHNAVEIDRACAVLADNTATALSDSDASGSVTVRIHFRAGKITGLERTIYYTEKPLSK